MQTLASSAVSVVEFDHVIGSGPLMNHVNGGDFERSVGKCWQR